jgi:hypothetical protein
VSARELAFVESGRERPGPDLVSALAEQLEVPPRERNELLVAAGHPPAFPRRQLDDPALAAVREALERMLDAHEPYPAVVVDRDWTLLGATAGLRLLLGDAQPPAGDLRQAVPELHALADPLRVRGTAYGRLSFHVAVTRFPAASDLTVAELSVVALHPADARTRSAARAAALRHSGR